MTEVEAREEADFQNRMEPYWFCPLTNNGSCGKNCVNWEEAKAFHLDNFIGTKTEFGWSITGAGCRFFKRGVKDGG